MSICNDNNSAILSINQPADIAWNMGSGVPGSFDGLILRPGGSSTWRKQPNNVPLKRGKMYTSFGTPLPLKCEMMYQKVPQNPMFVFARNVASPACCPSTYSTDTGCVCTDAQMRRYIAQQRGNNKNYSNYSF